MTLAQIDMDLNLVVSADSVDSAVVERLGL